MTTKLPPEVYREVWEKAAEVEIGIGIEVVPEDQGKLVAALYACRDRIGGFENIMVFQPEPKGQVWMVKQGVEMPE